MFKRIIAWLLVLIWMMVIFKFSAETGEVSAGKSQVITKNIQSFISKTSLDNKIQWTDHETRKTGHVMEYLILTALIINAFVKSGAVGIRAIFITILISILYASLDEFHQSFTADRGPSVRDVLIDCIGIFIAMLLYMIRKKYIKSKIKRPMQNA